MSFGIALRVKGMVWGKNVWVVGWYKKSTFGEKSKIVMSFTEIKNE